MTFYKQKAFCLVFASLMFYPLISVSYSQTQSLVAPYQQPTIEQNSLQSLPELIQVELGKTIEKELKGGETHSYLLNLDKGQYIELTVEQKGIDVVVAVYDPSNQKVYELDSPNGTEGLEPVYLATTTIGRYRLEVRSDDKKAKHGKYEVKIKEIRLAVDADKIRVSGHKVYGEAELLRAEGKIESLKKAIVKYEEAISLFHSVEDATGEADSYNTLGRLYQAIGEYTKAETMLLKSLMVKENALGAEHPDLAFFCNTLGVLYKVKGEYEKAERYYKQALTIREKAVGADHPSLATFYNNLGDLYNSKGELNKAEPLLEKALAIYEKELGQEHINIANCCNSLGLLYMSKGELNKAESLFQRALTIYEKVLSENNLLVARVCSNFGLLYQLKGEFDKTEKLLQRSLTIREKLLGKEHPDVAINCNNLGDFYRNREDYEKAEPLLQQALAIVEKTLGADHPNRAAILNNLGLLCQAKGEYDKAELFFKKALTINEKALGMNHASVATNNFNLGLFYQAKGEYDKAELFFKKALTINEKTLGVGHHEIAKSYSSLGAIYQAKGEYDKAELFFKQALAIKQKALGLEHFDVGGDLSNLALLYQAKGEYDKAELFFKQALIIREKVLGTNRPDLLISNNLGLLYTIKGEYDKAELLFTGRLEIVEKILGGNHPLVATFCNNLAKLYNDKGEYEKAESLYKRALTIREKALGTNHSEVGTNYNNLGLLYTDKGEYEKAEPLLQKSLAIREKVLGLQHPDVAQSCNNLGSLYLSKNDTEKAEPLLLRALAIREKALGLEHPNLAVSYSSLGDFYYIEREYEKAESFYKQALTIIEKTFGTKDRKVAGVYNNLGVLYQAKKDYQKAEVFLQKALTISEKVLGNAHSDVAQFCNNLAELYKIKGEYIKAEPLFLQALTVVEKALGNAHPYTATFANNLGVFYLATGNTEKAIAYINKANESREAEFSHNLVGGSESQKLLYLKQTSFEQDLTISLNVQNAPRDLIATQAAISIILRRKGRTLDALVNSFRALRSQIEPENQKLLEELINKYTYLSKITLSGPDKESNEAYQIKLKNLNEQVEKLEIEISSRSIKFGIQKAPITLENVQQAIPVDGVLIEFSTYRPYDAKNNKYGDLRYVVYVLTHEGKINFADLGEATSIEQATKEFRETLVRKEGIGLSNINNALKPKAQAINKLVLEPIRKLLTDKTHLLISPDGSLNTIPFEVFVDENGKYLVENYEISYLTSGRDLLRLQTKTPNKQPPTIVGDPDYGTGSGAVLLGQQYPVRPLLASIQEVNNIKNIFPNAKVYVKQEATKEVVKNISSPEILHITTHGYYLDNTSLIQTSPINLQNSLNTSFSSDNSISTVNLEALRKSNPLLRTWLFFAGANNNTEDSVMTGLEITGLNLFSTKLVVLSACNSGLGEVKNNEGVYGQRRALVLAGAETQMTSLWQVDDDATKDLLVSYYKLLKSGESRNKALRKIQLSFLYKTPLKLENSKLSASRKKTLNISNINNDYSHPYFWASFIVSGNWRNLEGK